MSNIKAPISYVIIETADGSPTLSLSGGEKMHSTDGAFSETLYIYGPAIENVLQLNTPHILSMGLGLGYNEILAISTLLKNNKHEYQITSFELIDELKENFINWACSRHKTPLDTCYQSICEKLSEKFNITGTQIKTQIKKSLQNESLKILGPLTERNTTDIKFNAILYDAFSNHTDPGLWMSDHLNQFIDNFCDDQYCYFSTYAATGELKRSLKQKEFKLQKRKGFSRKRESIFAERIRVIPH